MRSRLCVAIGAVAVLAFGVAGCSSFTQSVPRTPGQILYSTYGLYTFVENETANLYRENHITKATAVKIRSELATWRPTLKRARLAVQKKDGLTTKQQKALAVIQQGLLSLQKQLKGK